MRFIIVQLFLFKICGFTEWKTVRQILSGEMMAFNFIYFQTVIVRGFLESLTAENLIRVHSSELTGIQARTLIVYCCLWIILLQEGFRKSWQTFFSACTESNTLAFVGHVVPVCQLSATAACQSCQNAKLRHVRKRNRWQDR